MRYAGMNNFTAVDIHTLTNRRKSYSRDGDGFIYGKKKQGIKSSAKKIDHRC